MRNQADYPFEIRPLSATEGGGYLISYPDFSECVSDGESVEEAIRNGAGSTGPPSQEVAPQI